MLRLSSVRFLSSHLVVVRKTIFFLMVSFVATSVMAADVWVNKEGKRPWIDLPYKDWPIFKEDNPKLIKKEVAYIDTGVEEKEKWQQLKWLDNLRFFIIYENREKSKERGGATSTDIYNIDTKIIKSVSNKVSVSYIDRNKNMIDAFLFDVNGAGLKRVFQFKYDNLDVSYYRDLDYEKKELYSDSRIACWDAFQPPEGYTYQYIDGTDCKSYFITGKPYNFRINQYGKTMFDKDSAMSLVDKNGQEKKMFYDGLPLSKRALYDLQYTPFLDAYYARFYNVVKAEELEDEPLFLIISKQGDVEGIKYPIALMKKIKADVDWVDGAEPIASGLILNTNKKNYLITPTAIKELTGSGEVSFYNPKAAFSPNGCKLVYPSQRIYIVFKQTKTLKIHDYCQGE